MILKLGAAILRPIGKNLNSEKEDYAKDSKAAKEESETEVILVMPSEPGPLTADR